MGVIHGYGCKNQRPISEKAVPLFEVDYLMFVPGAGHMLLAEGDIT